MTECVAASVCEHVTVHLCSLIQMFASRHTSVKTSFQGSCIIHLTFTALYFADLFFFPVCERDLEVIRHALPGSWD